MHMLFAWEIRKKYARRACDDTGVRVTERRGWFFFTECSTAVSVDEGSTSTFGAPYYGEAILGRVIWEESNGKAHCTDQDPF